MVPSIKFRERPLSQLDKMKQLQLLIVLLGISIMGCNTEPDSTIDPPAGKIEVSVELDPDEPYQKFSTAYENLNATLLAEAYTEHAVLMNLYNEAEPTSFRGRSKIQDFFDELFTLARNDDRTLNITFHVTDRQLFANQILDNGFYKLSVSSAKQAGYDRYGKFSIVLQQESGEWKFLVDANASATQVEYEKAMIQTSESNSEK